MSRQPIDPRLTEIFPLTSEHLEAVNGFSCEDEDLDDFIRSDALRLQEHDIIRVYCAHYDGRMVGYIALLTDAIKLETKERKQLLLESDSYPIVPALKIARLAISAEFRATHRGMGERLVLHACAKALAILKHAGCRLLTVDAYPSSVPFYEKLGFKHNRSKEYRNKHHPSMRLDILRSALASNLIQWIASAPSSGEP